MKYFIQFADVCAFNSETIEAESLEEAEKIAEELAENATDDNTKVVVHSITSEEE